MIDIELVVQNYRCFGDEPARFRFSEGFTALVGTNNSGKSSLLRLLYEIRPLLHRLADPTEERVGDWLRRGARLEKAWAPSVLTGERIHRAGSERPTRLQIIVHDGPIGPFSFNSRQLLLDVEVDEHQVTTTRLIDTTGHTYGQANSQVHPSQGIDFSPLILAMHELCETMYIGPFRNAINVGANENYYDIQTGDAFVTRFATLKSGSNFRDNESVAEMIKDLSRIFNFGSLDLNASPDMKTLQATIDGKSFRLTEQGAGLAHFVLVLINTLVKRPTFLLVDEPELNLNASLQLDFLSTLAKYTKYGIIFATHSLGLARTSADRIYTISRHPSQPSRVNLYDSEPELVTLLGQLAFDRRPELGFSRVLLVEGKTELRAIAQLLRLYRKEHEVLLIPLHGGEMIRGDVAQELSDLKRLGGPLRFLIDSEVTAEGAPLERTREEFVSLCEDLGIEGHVLKRRAIENYFSERAIHSVCDQNTPALGPYEKMQRSTGWSKTTNWRIAAEMRRSELDGTDLGEFLERV